MEIKLTQAEADTLIGMEKYRADDQMRDFPSMGDGVVSVPLISADKREQFSLDIRRGKMSLVKGTYQNRSRNVIVLVRLDVGGQPHRNPDNEEVHSPHIHIYREGFNDKWAIPLPADIFTNVDDLWLTLQQFTSYCNVVEPLNIRRGLFV